MRSTEKTKAYQRTYRRRVKEIKRMAKEIGYIDPVRKSWKQYKEGVLNRMKEIDSMQQKLFAKDILFR